MNRRLNDLPTPLTHFRSSGKRQQLVQIGIFALGSQEQVHVAHVELHYDIWFSSYCFRADEHSIIQRQALDRRDFMARIQHTNALWKRDQHSDTDAAVQPCSAPVLALRLCRLINLVRRGEV